MATGSFILTTLIVVLGASGTYLLLPHAHGGALPARQHKVGAVVAAIALVLFLVLLRPPAPFLASVFFYLFSIAALAGAFLMITSTNPVHSALWFASVVLSTSGLFLLAGAPFLAAGTVIVYAGAIIVTFLFVIMLAQMEGKAPYDRAARDPGRATLTCFLLLWCLIFALTGLPAAERSSSTRRGTLERQQLPKLTNLEDAEQPRRTELHLTAVARAVPPTLRTSAPARDGKISQKPNVAGLGTALYTDHLVTVGVAGALLFVALVGAVAIANPRRPPGHAA
jgi:NADH-quinone oxidoreductase subunit J